MELEVGMYVRFNGIIGKIEDVEEIKEIDPDFIEIEESYKDEYDEYTSLVRIEYIEKASHNIIDLIEVGDYVNGIKVDGRWFGPSLQEKYIKEILTKEQYEANVYRVESDTNA